MNKFAIFTNIKSVAIMITRKSIESTQLHPAIAKGSRSILKETTNICTNLDYQFSIVEFNLQVQLINSYIIMPPI